MYGYVYKISNRINTKVYIGQKKWDFDPRYFGSGILIRRAIRKYGIKNFKVKMIAGAETQKELDVLEKYYVRKYKSNSYNIAEGGLGGNMGYDSKGKNNGYYGIKHTKEIRNKISRGLKGKPLTKEHCLNISKSKRGVRTGRNSSFGIKRKPHSEKTKQKICNSILMHFKNRGISCLKK